MRYLLPFFTVATVLACSAPHAKSFDYVQLSYLESDAFNLKLDGPQIDISKRFGERYFVAGGYGNFDADVNGFDVDSEIMHARLGILSHPVQNPSLTLLGGLEVIRVAYSFQALDESDTGYGGFVGVRNQVTDDIEFIGEGRLTRVFDDTSFSASLGLRYYVRPQLSLHASGSMGDMSGYQLGAAFHF